MTPCKHNFKILFLVWHPIYNVFVFTEQIQDCSLENDVE